MVSKKEYLILVDKQDNQIGVEEKMQVHVKGNLHRAFSILIFNSKKELLIQQRAKTKYHCPEIWANTCCSHPHPKEELLDAAHRRLKQEMGFDCPLKKKLKFSYRAKFDNGLIENEVDTVLVGHYDKDPKINKKEVSNFKWISKKELILDIRKNSEKYAIWFKIILDKLAKK